MKKIVKTGAILILAGVVLYLAGILLENYANRMETTPKTPPAHSESTLGK